MERASSAAYALPSATIVSPSVAKATEGAAPKSPAKLLGFSTSPIMAKKETTNPPIRNRNISSIVPPQCFVALIPQTGAADRELFTGRHSLAARTDRKREKSHLPL